MNIPYPYREGDRVILKTFEEIAEEFGGTDRDGDISTSYRRPVGDDGGTWFVFGDDCRYLGKEAVISRIYYYMDDCSSYPTGLIDFCVTTLSADGDESKCTFPYTVIKCYVDETADEVLEEPDKNLFDMLFT